MANFADFAPRAAATPARIILDAFAELGAFAARRREYKRVYNELVNLSDRDLADLGIGRYMIADIAAQAAKRV